jgi:hypothetical protein
MVKNPFNLALNVDSPAVTLGYMLAQSHPQSGRPLVVNGSRRAALSLLGHSATCITEAQNQVCF